VKRVGEGDQCVSGATGTGLGEERAGGLGGGIGWADFCPGVLGTSGGGEVPRCQWPTGGNFGHATRDRQPGCGSGWCGAKRAPVRTRAAKARQLARLGQERLIGREPVGNRAAGASAEQGSGTGDWV
jgi:hypothetical protein